MSAPQPAESSSFLARGLAIFLLLNALVLNGLVWLASPEGYKETVLDHTVDVLLGKSGDDSWGAMAIALDYLEEGEPVPLYTEVFFDQNVKFQYPPSALFALQAMYLAGPNTVRTSDLDVYIWPTVNDVLGWLFIALSIAATAALFELLLRRSCGFERDRIQVALRVALVAGFALTFYPIVKAFTLGQIQVWINSVFAIALFCWATGRRAPAGVLMGLICLIKPHYGLFVLWGLLRGEWRFITACVVTGTIGLVASIAVYGWENHLDYLPVLSHLAERGEAFYPNQSINGLANRIMSIWDGHLFNNVEVRAGHFPPYTPWVYWLTFVTSAAILIAAVVRRNRAGDPGRLFDFCTMAVSCTVASPIAWEHHYGVLLPVYAVVLVNALRNRAWLPWVIVSYVLASNYFVATQLLAPTFWNFVQSYLLFATLILLVLLHLRPEPALAGSTQVTKPKTQDAPRLEPQLAGAFSYGDAGDRR
jgi:hypothetical protein